MQRNRSRKRRTSGESADPPSGDDRRASAHDARYRRHMSTTENTQSSIGGSAPLDLASIRSAPKALLHDHLDGGLRPQTVLELADECGYDGLPATDGAALGEWFRDAADSGSLERYLETFAHTVAVMQTPEGLFRVARECAEDLADDGVVYAEVRFAPEQHLERGLTLDEVVTHTLAGFEAGISAAKVRGKNITIGTLLTAMRHAARSREIAELTVRFRDRGVVGFDIAGAEAGFPPSRHLDAFEYMRASNAHFTIHAGEAFGLPSIQEAVAFCGTDRLGHGVRITDDITTNSDGTPSLGLLAAYVRDTRMPLELCPSSNVQTGAVESLATHPFDLLARLRFRVTVNTDNRLMSDTSMSREMVKLVETFGYGWSDLERFTINAMKSAFLPFDERLALIDDVIKPGYAVLIG
jgi:adenosine deaminase